MGVITFPSTKGLSEAEAQQIRRLLDQCVEQVANLDQWRTMTFSGDKIRYEYRFKVQADNEIEIRRILQRFDIIHTYDFTATRFGDSGIVLAIFEREQGPMTDFAKGR